MNDPETLALLSNRVDALEKRVRDLEQLSASSQLSVLGIPDPVGALHSDLPSSEQVSGIFLVLGKAMLGIAGAYLLRALAESGVLPWFLIAAVAIVYAIAWLIAAARTKPQARFAAILYSGASALILAPMLWELTMRFRVLSPAASAAVLGLFVVVAAGLAWRRDSAPDFSVAYGAAGLTALALSIVTHVMMPFLVLLLGMVAVCEYHAVRARGEGIRILVAAVADCAVWILLFIYHTPANTRADYPALGTAAVITAPCLLFVLAASSAVFKTAVLRRRISAFESIQAVIAFLLAACAPILVVPGFSARIVGAICLVFAAACYGAALGDFRRGAEPRNFRVFALWSVGLLLGGAFLSFPHALAVSLIGAAAAVCVLGAGKLNCPTLEWHGAAYLTLAVFASGLPTYAFHSLAGPMQIAVTGTMLLVSGCTMLCYAAARERESEDWRQQLLHLVLASLAVCAVAALMTEGSLWLVALRVTPGAFHIAFIRTLTLCAVALALAFAGSRWRRLEMRRVAYAVLAFVAAKLLFEDLRHGHMGFIAGSIFLFALTLIGVPRLARTRTNA